MSITPTLVPLRWSDMDAYGHVNNVQYLRLLEESRITAFAQWFGGRGEHSMLAGGVIVARQEIDYLLPLVHRTAPVLVELRVSHVGGSSFEVGYELRDPEDVGDRLYARAESTLAAFDLETERPRRLPAEAREILLGLLTDPVPMRRRR
jgi:acyl-CoA thioester hydrolase